MRKEKYSPVCSERTDLTEGHHPESASQDLGMGIQSVFGMHTSLGSGVGKAGRFRDVPPASEGSRQKEKSRRKKEVR